MADDYGAPADFDVCRMTASMAIVAALEMDFDAEVPTLSRRGWAPPPATGSPEVEYGAAFAIASIVYAFDLDREAVARVAEQIAPGN